MTKRKIRFLLLAILLSAVFVVSGIQIYGELAARQKEKNEFEELAALVEASQPDSMPWPDMEPEDGEEAMPEPEATEPAGAEEALRDLSALFARNGDCIGWLSIPDTAVDYPVMHTPENPQKYLRRSFYGEYSVSGVPFLDSRCSLGGDNLIIYGHNMNDETMFAHILAMTDQATFDAARTFYILTPTQNYRCRTYALDVVKNTETNILQPNFADEAAMRSYMTARINDSAVGAPTDVDLASVTKLFTLITCGDDYANTRAVLCGGCVEQATPANAE